MRTILLALLLAGAAHADDDVARRSRGDLLKAHQYESFGAYTLFVDPTGNDANACTSTGVNACLTFQGALNKLPKLLRHNASITAAAGSYAGFVVSGFVIDPSVQKTTAGLLITSALVNVTPATGTATGTATAGSAGSGSTFGTLTDGAQTWTVNDPALVGRFVVITGGTGNGQIRTIVSNTATALTIAGTWTAPTGTSTYALQAPSATITSSTALVPAAAADPLLGSTAMAAAGIQLADNVTGASNIVVQKLGITLTATKGVLAVNSGSLGFTQLVTSTTTGNGIEVWGGGATSTISSATTTTGTGFLAGGTIATTSSGNASSVFFSLFTTNTGNSSVAIRATNNAVLNGGGNQMNATVGLRADNGARVNWTMGSRCNCASAGTSACILAGSLPVSASPFSVASVDVSSANVDVTNCTSGLFASGGGSAISLLGTTVLSGNALTYGANATYGSIIVAPTSIATITAGTAEMSADNAAATGTWASLVASFSCLTNLSTASRVCRL